MPFSFCPRMSMCRADLRLTHMEAKLRSRATSRAHRHHGPTDMSSATPAHSQTCKEVSAYGCVPLSFCGGCDFVVLLPGGK